jgi:hypothetical protein
VISLLLSVHSPAAQDPHGDASGRVFISKDSVRFPRAIFGPSYTIGLWRSVFRGNKKCELCVLNALPWPFDA